MARLSPLAVQPGGRGVVGVVDKTAESVAVVTSPAKRGGVHHADIVEILIADVEGVRLGQKRIGGLQPGERHADQTGRAFALLKQA